MEGRSTSSEWISDGCEMEDVVGARLLMAEDAAREFGVVVLSRWSNCPVWLGRHALAPLAMLPQRAPCFTRAPISNGRKPCLFSTTTLAGAQMACCARRTPLAAPFLAVRSRQKPSGTRGCTGTPGATAVARRLQCQPESNLHCRPSVQPLAPLDLGFVEGRPGGGAGEARHMRAGQDTVARRLVGQSAAATAGLSEDIQLGPCMPSPIESSTTYPRFADFHRFHT